MKIRLKVPDGDFADMEVSEGTTLEEIYDRVKDDLPYPCVAAKVNNEYQGLTYRIHDEENVELLDMRTKGACRIYQASISMVFLTAEGPLSSQAHPSGCCMFPGDRFDHLHQID